jgi:hypothetical protein
MATFPKVATSGFGLSWCGSAALMQHAYESTTYNKDAVLQDQTAGQSSHCVSVGVLDNVPGGWHMSLNMHEQQVYAVTRL